MNSRKALAALAGVVAFCGALAITSGYGPGLDPDSMAYVGAATSFAEHGSLRVPSSRWESRDSTVVLTTWPPLFPVTMGIVQVAGIPPLASARIVIAAAAFATAATVFLLLWDAVGVLPSLAGVAAILVTPAFVGAHLSVLSEPLFLACLALVLFGMVRGRASLAGLAAAAAVMTRYAGACAGLAVAWWFFFSTDGPLTHRLRRSAVAALPSALSFAAWMIHNARVDVVQSGLKVSYYSGIAGTVLQGLHTVSSWLAPGIDGPLGPAIALFAAGVLSAAAVRAMALATAERGEVNARRLRLARAALTLLGSYLVVLVSSRLFVGGSIQFDWRLLAPAILLVEIAAAVALTIAFRSTRKWLRLVLPVALCAWLVAAVHSTAPLVDDAITDGNDFAASDWRDSPTLEWVRRQNGAVPLYSNWPAAIYFRSGRASYDIPNSANADTLRLFGSVLAGRRGKFIAFDVRNPDYPSSDSIAHAAGLVEVQRFADGAVWAANPAER